jgi:hypothetical protein
MITTPNVKINLGLNILRKREDGFHDLETLFVPYFGIHDTLEIITGDDYSRTSAALFAKYGEGVPATQGTQKPEGVFGVETHENDAPKINNYQWKEWSEELTEKVNTNLATYTSGYTAPRTTTVKAKEAIQNIADVTSTPKNVETKSSISDDDIPEGTASMDDDDWVNSILEG